MQQLKSHSAPAASGKDSCPQLKLHRPSTLDFSPPQIPGYAKDIFDLTISYLVSSIPATAPGMIGIEAEEVVESMEKMASEAFATEDNNDAAEC